MNENAVFKLMQSVCCNQNASDRIHKHRNKIKCDVTDEICKYNDCPLKTQIIIAYMNKG